jgi:hypothetical protein
MSKFNIFRSSIDSALAKQTEQYWRDKISEDIYKSCLYVKRGGYPCEECYDFYEFVLYKREPDHDR